jgi:hypothetical protein
MSDISLNFEYNQNTFSMDCRSDDKISIVKMRLQDSQGLDPEKIILRYPSNQLLVDGKELNDYDLTVTNPIPIEISVKNESGGGGRKRRRRTKRRGSKKRKTRRSKRTRRTRRSR